MTWIKVPSALGAIQKILQQSGVNGVELTERGESGEEQDNSGVTRRLDVRFHNQ